MIYPRANLPKASHATRRRNWQSLGHAMRVCYPLTEGAGATLADIGRRNTAGEMPWQDGTTTHDLQVINPGIYQNNGNISERSISLGNPWTTVAGRGPVLDFSTLDQWIPMLRSTSVGDIHLWQGEILFAIAPSAAGGSAVRRIVSTNRVGGSVGGFRLSLKISPLNSVRWEEFAPDSGSVILDIATPDGYPADQWIHGSIWWRGTERRIYINDPTVPAVTGTSTVAGVHLPGGDGVTHSYVWFGAGDPQNSGNTANRFLRGLADTPYIFSETLPDVRRREYFIDWAHGYRAYTPASFARKRVAWPVLPRRDGNNVEVTFDIPIRYEGVEAGRQPQLGVMACMPGDAAWITKWGTALTDSAPRGSRAEVTLTTADLPGMVAGTRPLVLPIFRDLPGDTAQPVAAGLYVDQLFGEANLCFVGDSHDGVREELGDAIEPRPVGGAEILDWGNLGTLLSPTPGREPGTEGAGTEQAWLQHGNYAHIFESAESRNIGPVIHIGDMLQLDLADDLDEAHRNDDDNPSMWLMCATVQDNAADLAKSGVPLLAKGNHDFGTGTQHFCRKRANGPNQPGAWSKQTASALSVFWRLPTHETFAAQLGMDSGPGGDYDPSPDYEPRYNDPTYVDAGGNQYTNSGPGNYRSKFLVHGRGVPHWIGGFYAVVWDDLVIRVGDCWGPCSPGDPGAGNWVNQTGGSQHIDPNAANPKPWRWGPVQTQWRWDVGAAAMERGLRLLDVSHTWPDSNDSALPDGSDDRYGRTAGAVLPVETADAIETDREMREHRSLGFVQGHQHMFCEVTRGGGAKVWTVPSGGAVNNWAHTAPLVSGEFSAKGFNYGYAATRGRTFAFPTDDAYLNTSQVLRTTYLAAAWLLVKADGEVIPIQTGYSLTSGGASGVINLDRPSGYEHYAGETDEVQVASGGAVPTAGLQSLERATIAAVVPHDQHPDGEGYATDPADYANAPGWGAQSMADDDWNFRYGLAAPHAVDYHGQAGCWAGATEIPVSANADGLNVSVMYVPRELPSSMLTMAGLLTATLGVSAGNAQAKAYTGRASVTPGTAQWTITNLGGDGVGDVAWTAASNAAWASVSPAAGTLSPGQSVTVTATLSAAGMIGGDYAATITFTNTTNGVGNATRTISLDVASVPRRIIRALKSVLAAGGYKVRTLPVNYVEARPDTVILHPRPLGRDPQNKGRIVLRIGVAVSATLRKDDEAGLAYEDMFVAAEQVYGLCDPATLQAALHAAEPCAEYCVRDDDQDLAWSGEMEHGRACWASFELVCYYRRPT